MVSQHHPEYDRAFPDWELARACADGERAIKSMAERYLPRPNGFDQHQYDEYLMRAEFFNATGRTIDGLTGMIFRKTPLVSGRESDPVDQLVENATANGSTLFDLAQEAVEEVITVGRVGVLVDYPQEQEGRQLTIAEAERLGLRPYLRLYTAESIINWRTTIVRGQEVLTMVVLTEEHDEAGDDEFDVVHRTFYRVLTLEEPETNPFYRIRLMEVQAHETSDGETFRAEYVHVDTVGRRNGAVLTEIPFLFIGTVNSAPDVQRSPVIDVARANLSHYRTAADIEWGSHKTALPTLVITGHERDVAVEGPLYIGSDRAMTLREPDARAFFLEFTGAGMGTLLKLEEVKRDRMAVLGARILQADKRQVESAETALLHRQGEHATLSSMASTIADALTRQLRVAAEWNGASLAEAENVFVELNTDYLPHAIDATQLAALVRAWQEGALSWGELSEALQRGEIADATLTAEERREIIDQDPGRLGSLFDGVET